MIFLSDDVAYSNISEKGHWASNQENCEEPVHYNTTSAVYARLSVNRDMVKHYEALGLLTTPVYIFALLTHDTASLLSTGLFITRY